MSGLILSQLLYAIHMTVSLYCFLDSYDQRAEARKALCQDQTWINNYIKKMLKMLVKQVHFCTPSPLFNIVILAKGMTYT